MGFFSKLGQPEAVPALVISNIETVESMQYVDLVPQPYTPESERTIEVYLNKLPEERRKAFIASFLRLFERKAWYWKRYSFVSGILHRSTMNNNLVVGWNGGFFLTYDVKVEDKKALVELLKEYRND